ncbi:hypothetical protein BVC80_9061g10 [Macleaya cordata]|uniref:Uncharacterized protein n=1 Tax=Macleaya cordata TaxID=56857 RepID=A0A200PN10_MACCD|nr:hypothetical protein BVC80_9061g10 [Macleaya cordata]
MTFSLLGFVSGCIKLFATMQHLPTTIEEQLFLKAIKEECPWESLPKRLQATLSSKDEWHRKLVYFRYSI